MIKQTSRSGLNSQNQYLSYLGHKFRPMLKSKINLDDKDYGKKLIKDNIFIQIDRFEDKTNFLINVLQKLYALVDSKCCEDNPDALAYHELLLPGQILGKYLRENLDDLLYTIHDYLIRNHMYSESFQTHYNNYKEFLKLDKMIERMPTIGKKIEYLINTGNLESKSGLELQQTSGFTVVVERLNFFRFLSHIRSVHRGAYFAENRTTKVRKLLPESWGFICPVNTPDGAPCGLLNHLTKSCQVVGHAISCKEIEGIVMGLFDLGVIPISRIRCTTSFQEYLTVTMNGLIFGYIHETRVSVFISEIRESKADTLDYIDKNVSNNYTGIKIPWHLEVAHIPYSKGGSYPGLFLFTNDSRMVRPVLQLKTRKIEFVGTFEQQFMDIACPDGGTGGSASLIFTHTEIEPSQIFSVIASLTPYSDYNQSPRNMYQCQMSKQTIGIPAHNLDFRTDTKIYLLQSPQTPIVQTQEYDSYHMNEYPNGTNAVVAVLAYTGHDMEDAVVFNKKSVNFGFACASLYINEFINLIDKHGQTTRYVFTMNNTQNVNQKSESKNQK
jgi:DNA-directed RNA polymerase I subunit RPA2